MDKQTPSGIYKISFGGDKIYVGSAVNLTKRKNNHLYDLRHGKHTNAHLQNAWAKHGSEAFTFEVLERVPVLEDLIKREQTWLDTLRAQGVQMYNILSVAGSRLGTKQTPEAIAKMVAKKKGHKASEETKLLLSNIRKGKSLSTEHKEALSKAAQGKKLSQATKDKISAYGKTREINPLSIEKMREANLGRALTEEHKKKIGQANSKKSQNV